MKAYELSSIETSVLLWKNFAIQQVLRAGIWTSQTTFTIYLRNVANRHIDSFSLSPLVAFQQVM